MLRHVGTAQGVDERQRHLTLTKVISRRLADDGIIVVVKGIVLDLEADAQHAGIAAQLIDRRARCVVGISADGGTALEPVNPDGGTIDFGTVDNEAGATKSKTITITNTGLQPVTPTLSALTAPFSTDYTPTQLASGESVTITVTFTPTAEGTFTNGATLSFGNGIADCAFTLTGKGGKYDENDHSAIYDKDYTWIDANGNEHTSNLLEIATEPEQMIAMLRKVYSMS